MIIKLKVQGICIQFLKLKKKKGNKFNIFGRYPNIDQDVLNA